MVKNTDVNLAKTIRSTKLQATANSPLIVRDWSRTRVKGAPGVSASVDGFQVNFNGSSLGNVPERSDVFLAISLLPAMYHNRPLDLTAMPPVSAGLLASIDKVQEIWSCWNPYLHRVPILAREEPTPSEGGAITFFSGGVDAVHSVLHLKEKAGQLVMINGFDFTMDNTAFAAVHKRLGKLAERLGHELLTIETNWIAMTRNQRIARSTSHGACLAGLAHLMHPAEANIASSFSWAALFPWGSHPLLDHHWSSDSVQISHVGNDSPRVEKIALIAQQPDLLKLLWVCFEDPVANCGKCPKCLRTRAMLSILDADTSAFPPSEGDALDPWLNMMAKGTELVYLNEVKEVAKRKNREDILPRLAKGERAALRRDVLRRLWRNLLPDLAKKQDDKLDLQPWGRGPRPEL
ncbi:MAG: hypothetical protein V4628_18185 [Pseudomonadota bacterium]